MTTFLVSCAAATAPRAAAPPAATATRARSVRADVDGVGKVRDRSYVARGEGCSKRRRVPAATAAQVLLQQAQHDGVTAVA
jgi:hypothetical protein